MIGHETIKLKDCNNKKSKNSPRRKRNMRTSKLNEEQQKKKLIRDTTTAHNRDNDPSTQISIKQSQLHIKYVYFFFFVCACVFFYCDRLKLPNLFRKCNVWCDRRRRKKKSLALRYLNVRPKTALDIRLFLLLFFFVRRRCGQSPHFHQGAMAIITHRRYVYGATRTHFVCFFLFCRLRLCISYSQPSVYVYASHLKR